ncbi:dipeptidase [Oceanirhabdus sp. W0125-5]|uniref:dipeptidase n=1 Tax=Oceanirhabdus sp. W0125-5 TaxID=2999116 RepID=UPI0022F2D440|nr:dipeptidase [Oceanirhabdus sp. W0125-5]WBW99345.1 dipeptidase [Oceanirhabdus sp. W0125-5]
MLIDFHCDTIMQLYNHRGNENLRSNPFHIDIEKLQKAKSFAQFFALFIDMEECKDLSKKPYQVALEMGEIFKKEINENKEIIAYAGSINDYLANKNNGKISAFLTVEEGGIIGNDIEKLNELCKLGVRLITLTWNYENSIGIPAADGRNLGLKPFGFEVIKTMENLGVIIDVSHLSDKGFYDVYENTSKPFVASHSNSRSICNHPRNLTDDMIRKIGERGGVIGINYCPAFISQKAITTVEGIVQHMKYIRNIGGLDVLALGSDYDGISGTLEMKDVSYNYLLIQELEKKGFKIGDIEKILFKNGERLIKDVLK